jgi:transposase
MEYISGEDREQTILLPDCLDKYIDPNNAVRVIDAYITSLDLAELGFKNPEPHETGRPMYDPKDMLKLYVYGYMNRIRSSRRLETETKRNLEVIWLLCSLSPDHKTIARFRHDNSAALKKVFGDFVRLCEGLELYGKELEAIDGSKFKAVNSKKRNYSDKKLEERIEKIESHIKEYLSELDRIDRSEGEGSGEKTAEEIAVLVKGLTERKDRYQGYRDELKQTGETQKSLTDSDSRLMKSHGKTEMSYNVQTAVDAKNKLVTAFKVTNKGNDMNSITPMVSEIQETIGSETKAVVTDAGYDSVQDIVAAQGRGVQVHVAGTDFDVCVPTNHPVPEITSHKDGRCLYLPDRNIALCPMGKTLYPRNYKKSQKEALFHNSNACKGCAHRCTKETRRGRRYQVFMEETDFSKEYNDENLYVKQVRITADKTIVKQRKSIVEHVFGTIKRNMDAEYCLTKGLGNVEGEFSLTFLAYNIKRVINILGVRKMIVNMA